MLWWVCFLRHERLGAGILHSRSSLHFREQQHQKRLAKKLRSFVYKLNSEALWYSAPVAQRIRRLPTEQKIQSSNLCGGTIFGLSSKP